MIEEKISSRYVMDSSAWLKYFLTGSKAIAEFVDAGKNLIFTSVISIYEVKKRLIKIEKPPKEIEAAINFMKLRSILINLNSWIAEKSVEDSVSKKLHTIDALIYRTAMQNNARLLTFDSDFEGKDNIIYLVE